MARWGMVIDLRRCIGCNSCSVACKAEQGTPPEIWYAYVSEMEVGKYPNSRRIFVPTLCNHCADPPCVKACPTGALSQRPDGVVLVDPDKCCGSRSCMTACPYGALHFYHKERTYFPDGPTLYEQLAYRNAQPGTVMKCNFCVHKIADGKYTSDPACVSTCVCESRIFGDLDDPESNVSKFIRLGARPLRPEAGTKPSVFYLQ